MKKRNIIVLSILVFAIILFIIGTFYDLEISKSIAISNNFVGIMFASFSEWPVYTCLVFVSFVMISGVKKIDSKPYKFICIIMGLMATLIAIFYQGEAIASINAYGYFNQNLTKLYFKLPIGIAILAPFAYFGFRFGKRYGEKETINVIIFMLLTFLVIMLYPQFVKPFFHRPRFRFIEQYDLNLYHRWFEPFKEYKDFASVYGKEEFKSFPSGHTASAFASMIVLYFMPYFNKRLRGKENMLLLIAICFGLVMGFMRIFVGAHFLTDVAFAMIVDAVITLIAFHIFDKLKEKEIKTGLLIDDKE